MSNVKPDNTDFVYKQLPTKVKSREDAKTSCEKIQEEKESGDHSVVNSGLSIPGNVTQQGINHNEYSKYHCDQ